MVGNLFTLSQSARARVQFVATTSGILTKNTTETFSESNTPASGSFSISSPGPRIARFMTGRVSFDLFLPLVKGAFNDERLVFFDPADWKDLIELQ